MLTNIGKYEIISELGQGAMGVVYKARDPLIGRLVALKTITSGLSGKPELLERFYQEARSAGALQHPNIVTIFELGKEGDIPYIAMEFLEGDSLEKIVARRDAIPLSKKIGFMSQICSALDYAHKHGVIHRDIKPGNIMMTKDGTVKVVDFGIARLVDTSKTQTGLMIGTPAYMSPQLLRGERADAQADIWALGVMLYEMVAYQRPFLGDNPAALMWNIISQQPKPLRDVASGCPAELEEIVGKMLEKEAALRLQTMEDVLLELDPLYKRLQRDRLGELVAESQQLIQNQELQRAQSLLREALHLDSSNAEAKTLLDRVGAEIRRVQSQTRAKEQLAKAQASFDAGRLEEAKTEAEAALRLDTKYESAQELTAKIKTAIDRIKTIQEKLQGAKLRIAEGSLPEADQLLEELLALDAANEQAKILRRQVRDEIARRERRKRVAEGLQQARALWSQQKHLQAVELLSALQQEFPGEGEISELLITVRHDQAEQEKQDLLTEARNLLAAQRYDDALAKLATLRSAYPSDPAVSHLTTLVQQEQQSRAKRQRFEEELAALRVKVSESKWDEALKRGELLSKEFPQEYELQELVKFVRSEQQRAEQKRALDEKVNQVRGLIDGGNFAQAVKAAEKALTEHASNIDLMILLERAQTLQKEKDKKDFLDKRIREVKARITRDELTDAVDLARQTMMVAGPDTDITQLLHSAEMEITQREKKKEQDKQFEAAKTLVGAGNFAEATRVLDQAMATQILDANDPRVKQALRDIHETEERKKREREAEEQRRAAELAQEQERKKKQEASEKKAAADKKATEKKAADKKAAEKKPQSVAPAKDDKSSGGAPPSAPAVPAPNWPTSPESTATEYAFQSATMMPGMASPSEAHPVEASASATMIASAAPTPVIDRPVEKPAQHVEQPTAFTATVVEPVLVEAEPKSARKKRPEVISEVRVEPIERIEAPADAKTEPPIWKQPIPLAIAGVVLVAVLGLTIYMVSRPSATTPPNSTPVTNGNDGGEPKVVDHTEPYKPLPVDPLQKLRDQQQASVSDAAKLEKSGNYQEAVNHLQAAVVPNGPYNDKIKAQIQQDTLALTNKELAGQIAQESTLFQQGMDAFSAGKLDDATGDFQKVLDLKVPNSAKASDATDYINNKIPQRKNENRLFDEGQQLVTSRDEDKLKQALSDLGQVRQMDPSRTDVAPLLNSITSTINAMDTEKDHQNQFAQLVSQFNAAKSPVDIQKLTALQSQFRTIENSNWTQAADARNYAENVIPPLLKPSEPPPPPPPMVDQPKVTITRSAPEKFQGVVNTGQMVGSGFLDEDLRAVSALVPQQIIEQAAKGSTVRLSVQVDQNGRISSGQATGDVASAILATAKSSWQFSVPHVQGKAVKTTVSVTVEF